MHLVGRKAMLLLTVVLSTRKKERKRAISQIQALTDVEFKCDCRVDAASAHRNDWPSDGV